MSFYIKAITTDYDGWATGGEFLIGKFDSIDEANTFMDESSKFELDYEGTYGRRYKLAEFRYSQVFIHDMANLLIDPKNFM